VKLFLPLSTANQTAGLLITSRFGPLLTNPSQKQTQIIKWFLIENEADSSSAPTFPAPLDLVRLSAQTQRAKIIFQKRELYPLRLLHTEHRIK
jgi:hypothetical protein